jgi:hypothetical protein
MESVTTREMVGKEEQNFRHLVPGMPGTMFLILEEFTCSQIFVRSRNPTGSLPMPRACKAT